MLMMEDKFEIERIARLTARSEIVAGQQATEQSCEVVAAVHPFGAFWQQPVYVYPGKPGDAP